MLNKLPLVSWNHSYWTQVINCFPTRKQIAGCHVRFIRSASITLCLFWRFFFFFFWRFLLSCGVCAQVAHTFQFALFFHTFIFFSFWGNNFLVSSQCKLKVQSFFEKDENDETSSTSNPGQSSEPKKFLFQTRYSSSGISSMLSLCWFHHQWSHFPPLLPFNSKFLGNIPVTYNPH